MRTIAYWLGALALLAVVPASAAGLSVQVKDGRARAVADAVVTVQPRDKSRLPMPGVRPSPETRTINQKDLAFVPYVEVLRTGDAVVFSNSDRTRHHVYSFSPTKAFQFVLAKGEHSTPMRLDKAGVIAVGCNIHDQMINYLVVSDAPWIARSDAQGRVDFRDLPGGVYDVRVWHPRLHKARADVAQSITIADASESRRLTFSLPLPADVQRQVDREQTRY